MATLKLALALLVVAIVVAKKRDPEYGEAEELAKLNQDIRELVQQIEALGCLPTGWQEPADESLEDQIEAAKERVEELTEERKECRMTAEEEKKMELEEED